MTGISGAGKSTALKMLEDSGYYCVDNLPVPLFGKFAELIENREGGLKDAAIGIDVRSGDELSQMGDTLDAWERRGIPHTVLFLDASDTTIIRRFKETRRTHPLAADDRIEDGIRLEREKLEFLKKRADYILDTSGLLVRDLRAELARIFRNNEKFSSLMVTVMSFGFKFGIPRDADLVFDVRFLPNPYYVQELREHTGNDEDIRDYVRQGGVADLFLEKLTDLLEYLLPYYVKEGKNSLVIAIGCTGGRHRSVAIATMLAEALRKREGIGLKLTHRDVRQGQEK